MLEEPCGASLETPGAGAKAGQESRLETLQRLGVLALPCQVSPTLKVI